MANSSRRISQLGQTTVLVANDRIVVLTNPANVSISNTQTITVPNFLAALGKNMPGPYANDGAANTAGVVIKGIYYDASGIVRIRLT